MNTTSSTPDPFDEDPVLEGEITDSTDHTDSTDATYSTGGDSSTHPADGTAQDEPEAPAGSEQDLDRLLARLVSLVHRKKLRRRGRGSGAGGPFADPTRGQGRLLALLKMQDGMPAKDLAYVLGIRPASLNELVTKLERAGLVVRERSPEDGRVMLVRLTEAGRATRQEIPDSDLFKGLTEEQRLTLAELLRIVIADLEAELGTPGPDLTPWMDELRAHLGEDRYETFVSTMTEALGPGWEHRLRGFLGRGKRRGGPRGGHRSGPHDGHAHGDRAGRRGFDPERLFGEDGPFGPNGPFGDRGPFGDDSPFGDKGLFGDDGPFGPNGPFGDNGPFGKKGPYGDSTGRSPRSE